MARLCSVFSPVLLLLLFHLTYPVTSFCFSGSTHQYSFRMDASTSSHADDTSASAAIAFAKLIGRLKTTPRTGWVRRGVPKYESVADHSWRVAALSLLLASDNNLDVAKCMQLAVMHDMAESIVGDIAPDDNVSKQDKQQMELDAAKTIAETLGGVDRDSSTGQSNAASYFLDRFHEVELRDTPEAKIVKDLDLLDMIIQADEYEERFGTDLSDFFQSTPPSRFQDPFMKRVAEQVHHGRRERIEQEKEAKRPRIALELSLKDQAFIDEYSRASSMNATDIESVVKALRAWDLR